jgi:hypothetical protein
VNLIIRVCHDPGNLAKERVVLFAESSCDVGKFILAETAFIKDGEVSSNLRRTFWLPDLTVTAGDLVVIYSKVGKNSSRENSDKSTSHFLYLGKAESIWGKSDSGIVLMEVSDWMSRRPSEPKST